MVEQNHIFSNSKFNIDTNKFKNSNLELNFEKTSNDTYLKSEQLKIQFKIIKVY